jgi:hypothetical protein
VRHGSKPRTLPAILPNTLLFEKSYFYGNMSKEEIKHEINKVLDQFSDQALEELLTFLKQLESTHSAALSSSNDLQKIISEDHQLLEKLAK